MEEQKKHNVKQYAGWIVAALLLIALGGWIYVQQTQVQELDSRIAQLEEELTAAQSDVAAAQEALTQAEADRDSAQGDLTAAQSRIEELTRQVEEEKARAQSIQEALDAYLTSDAANRQSQPSNYAKLYPEMYADPAAVETLAPAKTVYLTFDDGPSPRTAEVLDILKENGVKATFFVTGKTSEESQALMRRIVDEGHIIAAHTYTHQYKTVYASVESYLKDFHDIYTWVHEVTGVYPQVVRFPGGSVNGYNKKIYKDIVKEMDRRGFVHYDWNALNGDAEGKSYTVEEMTRKALAGVGTNHVIVLMHDSEPKTKTVQCLPAVIQGYKDAGYSFGVLTPEIKSITFD